MPDNRVNTGFLWLMVIYTIGFSACSSFKYRLADSYYEEGNYYKAIPHYLAVLQTSENEDVMVKLADSYRMTGQNNSALKWYQRIVQDGNAGPEYQFFYADALMKNGRYEDAKFYLNKYLQATQGDNRAEVMLLSCDSIASFYSDTLMYDISKLNIAAREGICFSPAFYKTGIAFLSPGSRVSSNAGIDVIPPTNYDIYTATIGSRGNWSEPEVLKGDINGFFNEGPLVFNSIFTKVYFTRNNYRETEIKKNSKGESVLKIFEGRLEGNSWKILEEMPFCSDQFNVAHPALSYDGKTLYFVSDMPWGYGGTDLYKVIYENDAWSNPQNLGPNINTTSNELFPFLQNDSVLYFASDGAPGLGGLDIYRSVKRHGRWEKPRNLGFPVNSSMDDFSFIIDQEGKVGYFSTNRNNGIDQIYSFKKNPPVLTVKGAIVDKESGSPLRNMTVTLESEGEPDQELSTGIDGTYKFTLKQNKKYKVKSGNNSFYYSEHEFSTYGMSESTELKSKLEMKQINLYDVEIVDGLKFLDKSDEFTPEGSKVLKTLAEMLQNNESLIVELYTYTDTRGSDVSNMTLTTSRAVRIEEFLAAQGVDASKFSVLPKGETNLLNHCVNGILCLDEEHDENNRVEMKILGFLN